MRNTVHFTMPGVGWPAETDEEPFSDILLARSAGWFVEILRGIDWLTFDPELCQEDWGVVVFARHDTMEFSIGLAFDEGEQGEEAWSAWVRHGSFSIRQRFTARGKAALRQLVADLERALRGAGAMQVRWE